MKYLKLMIFLVLFSTALLNTVHAETAEPKMVKITGLSMYPTYQNEELSLCENSKGHQIGDVVVFKFGENHIVHRIVGKVFTYFITKGDNNTLPDISLTSEDKIVCKLKDQRSMTI